MNMHFGQSLRMTLFGSSHGPMVGAIVDGVPAGTTIDIVSIQGELDRRRPFGRTLATKRMEKDELHLDSGVKDGKATGGPIVAHVLNEDVKGGPYKDLEDVPRPGHADFTARMRWGDGIDLSGGGIFSGRMTVGLVFAGAIARSMIEKKGVGVLAFTRSIGPVTVPRRVSELPIREMREAVREEETGAPDKQSGAEMASAIEEARRDGDSLGGVIEFRAEGVPPGVGEPFFDPVESVLAHAFLAIPAVKGVEFGAGFAAAGMRGSEHNDAFVIEDGVVRTRTNNSGGVLGGLTTGMPVIARVVVKPTSSIAKEQDSVSLSARQPRKLVVKGRHDPCIVPRAVPVVENLGAFVLADLMMRGGFL